MSEDLRREVAEAQARLDALRGDYARTRDDKTGRALLAARESASRALAALWEAHPEEKPPTQRVM